MMRLISVVLWIVLIGIGCDNHHSKHGPSLYVGQENREIKSLTDREVRGYLNGEGMGLSKVAELNNFPGPKHVLELSEELNLTEEQLAQTESLYKEMKKEATTLGQRYIAAKKELNELFEAHEIDRDHVDSLITQIGVLHANIRATHVQAHLKMKKLLSKEQVNRYQKLRGYRDGTHQHRMESH